MKALTICQPYAEMIRLGTKRVENRNWRSSYRGRIAIHAGKNLDYWDEEEDPQAYPEAVFGAVVAFADLVACVPIGEVKAGKFDEQFPWLREHEHALGPFCWVLDRVTSAPPFPCRGAQGLFDIDIESR